MYRPVNARVLVLACLMVVSSVGPLFAQGSQEPQQQPSAQTPAAPPEDSGRAEPQRISGAITNDPPLSYRLIAPPFLREKRGDVRTTALFPFYFERKAPDNLERFVLPYYYRRGSQLSADVPLGIVWWLRGPERNTFVLPPFYTHRNKKNWAIGLPPVFATGVLDGHHHTIIPPLLTWIDGDAKNRHTFVGPYWNWTSEHAEHWGVFPVLWIKRDEVDRYTVVPPFYFHFYDDDPKRDTTIVPPFYRRVIDDETSWGLVPLVFRSRSPRLKSTTVPLALFHHAKGPDEFRLVLPGLAYLKNKKTGRTWITPVYQRRRGDRNFDAFTPLFFHTWDNRDKSTGLILPPVYWHWEDPANDSTVVLPFIGRWFHEGISSTWVVPLLGRYKSFERDEQTWWVAPTFQYGWTETSWTFNIHPLLYIHEAPEKRHLAVAPFWFDFEHRENQTKRFVLFPLYWNFKNFAKQKRSLVLFPLYWDFKNQHKLAHRQVVFPLYWDFKDGRKKKRGQVAFPLYWHFERGDTKRSVVLNSYYEKKKDESGNHWQYHFMPFFSFGRGDRQQRWWSVLYGMAGSDKRGKHRRIHVLWIPFDLD